MKDNKVGETVYECVYISVCWIKGQAVYGNCTFAQFWKLKTAGKKNSLLVLRKHKVS